MRHLLALLDLLAHRLVHPIMSQQLAAARLENRYPVGTRVFGPNEPREQKHQQEPSHMRAATNSSNLVQELLVEAKVCLGVQLNHQIPGLGPGLHVALAQHEVALEGLHPHVGVVVLGVLDRGLGAGGLEDVHPPSGVGIGDVALFMSDELDDLFGLQLADLELDQRGLPAITTRSSEKPSLTTEPSVLRRKRTWTFLPS